MTAFWTLVRRDLALALREGSAVGTALGFYLLVVTLMPLGLGPDLKLLVAHRARRALDRAPARGAAVVAAHVRGRP